MYGSVGECVVEWRGREETYSIGEWRGLLLSGIIGVCWETNGESDISCRRLWECVGRAMVSRILTVGDYMSLL